MTYEILDSTTIVEERRPHWTDMLGSGFVEHTHLVEAKIRAYQREMESLRPGASSDKFQRLAGKIEALRWVIDLRTSQTPKPGVVDE